MNLLVCPAYSYVSIYEHNLFKQVSAGVSVAYFSSVALLGIAATRPAGTIQKSDTYFDSVVFLTMFLLVGE